MTKLQMQWEKENIDGRCNTFVWVCRMVEIRERDEEKEEQKKNKKTEKGQGWKEK